MADGSIAPACDVSTQDNYEFTIHVQTVGGSSLSIAATGSTCIQKTKRTVEVALGVPVASQRFLVRGETVRWSDEATLREVGVVDGDCVTVVLTLPFLWARSALGAEVVADSDHQEWRKIANEPDYSTAVAAPGFTTGVHMWQLRLRGPCKVEVGVCGHLREDELGQYMRSRTWNLRVVADSERRLDDIGINGGHWLRDHGGFVSPTGDPLPVPTYNERESESLLFRMHIDVEAGLMRIGVKDMLSVEYSILVPRPPYLKRDCELFPYVNADHVGSSFEFCCDP